MDETLKLYFYEGLKNNADLDFVFEKSPQFTWRQYCLIKEPQDPRDYYSGLECVKKTYKLAQQIAFQIPHTLTPMEFFISGANPQEIRAWTIDQNCTMQIRPSSHLVTGIIDLSVPNGTPLKSLLLVTRITNDIITFRNECKCFLNLY